MIVDIRDKSWNFDRRAQMQEPLVGIDRQGLGRVQVRRLQGGGVQQPDRPSRPGIDQIGTYWYFWTEDQGDCHEDVNGVAGGFMWIPTRVIDVRPTTGEVQLQFSAYDEDDDQWVSWSHGWISADPYPHLQEVFDNFRKPESEVPVESEADSEADSESDSDSVSESGSESDSESIARGGMEGEAESEAASEAEVESQEDLQSQISSLEAELLAGGVVVGKGATATTTLETGDDVRTQIISLEEDISTMEACVEETEAPAALGPVGETTPTPVAAVPPATMPPATPAPPTTALGGIGVCMPNDRDAEEPPARDKPAARDDPPGEAAEKQAMINAFKRWEKWKIDNPKGVQNLNEDPSSDPDEGALACLPPKLPNCKLLTYSCCGCVQMWTGVNGGLPGFTG